LAHPPGPWRASDRIGTSQPLAGINTPSLTTLAGAIVQNRELSNTTANRGTSILTLTGAGTYQYNGYIRDSDNGVSATNQIALVKSGSGTQTLAGNQLTYTGSTAVGNGTLVLQDTTAFASPVSLSGSGVLTSVRTAAGFGNRGKLFGSDTTAAVTGTGVIEINNAAGGILGGWTVVGRANGLTMAGTININSGTLARDNTSANNINTTATVNVAAGAAFGAGRGGNSTIGALNGAGDVGKYWSGTSAGYIPFGKGGGDGSFSGVLQGSGNATDGSLEGGVLSVTKIGSGTQVLSGSNTYTGTTTVNEGRLNINGSITSATTIATVGTLGGDGTITGDVSLSGTLMSGQGGVSDRSLTINGNVTTVAGSKLSFTITDEGSHDQLVMGAGKTINLANANLEVTLSDTSLIDLGAGGGASFLTDPAGSGASYYKLVDGTTTGMFANVTNTMNEASMNYLGLSGTQYITNLNGHDFWVAQGSTYLVAVPETSSALLVGLGTLGLALRRRRN